MSFSSQVRSELCRVPVSRDCCARAEFYGTLLYASLFSHREIRISTGSAEVAERLTVLFDRASGIRPASIDTGRKTQFVLTDTADINRVFTLLGYDYKSHVTYHLNRNILENDCCVPAFLRGAFLMAGSVAGPYKKSHLELRSAHQSLCGEVMSLLLDLRLFPKAVWRPGANLLYFKDGASVQKLLTLIGAPESAASLKKARTEKNIRNRINRQVNCETANILKTTEASARQVAAIQKALQAHGSSVFPENLRETVRLRLAYPTDSLAELAARFDPPISKPGLSHRLKRITAIAAKEETYAPVCTSSRSQ